MAFADLYGFKWQIDKILWFCQTKLCVIIWLFRDM